MDVEESIFIRHPSLLAFVVLGCIVVGITLIVGIVFAFASGETAPKKRVSPDKKITKNIVFGVRSYQSKVTIHADDDMEPDVEPTAV